MLHDMMIHACYTSITRLFCTNILYNPGIHAALNQSILTNKLGSLVQRINPLFRQRRN